MRLAVVGLVAALLGVVPAHAIAVAPQLLYDGQGIYPRVIRLEHSGPFNGRLVASVNGDEGGAGVGVILDSVDGGRTFRHLSTIREPDGAQGRGQCCGSLFELPRRLGTLPRGTLLWATTTGWKVGAGERRTTQRLWRSHDQGRSWSFLSDIFVSPGGYNAWEPELSMAADGSLVAHWADESDKPKHDQKLVQARSLDGIHWTDRRDTVKNDDFYVRPGMPGVRRLPDGSYFMVYEVCNLDEPLCSIYFRTSADGWDYGNPFDLGTGVRTVDGKYPRHTPTLDVTASGLVLLFSAMLVDADGDHAANNGAAILVGDRAGVWREIPAPVPVPGVDNEGCRNFSSALLVMPGDRSVLQIATDFHEGFCKPYYAIGPIA